MLALLLALTAAPPSPFGYADRVEVIGWSGDESRVALRVFYAGEAFELDKCPGYVGADGEPFNGGLALVVLEGSKLIKTFIIQRPRIEDLEEQRCTPVAAAREALARAKQAMDDLGIVRDAPAPPKLELVEAHGKAKVTTQKREEGPLTQTVWQDTWSSPEVAFQLNVRDSCDADGICERALSGTLQGPGPVPRKVLAQRALPKEPWDHNAAGTISMGFTVLRSPSQKVLLPFLFLHHVRMEGSWSTSHFLGPVAGTAETGPP